MNRGVTNLHVRGVVLPDGVQRDVFIIQGRFTFQPVNDARTILDGGFLLPGLVDVHAHLGLSSPAPPEAPPEEQARASARQQLEAGVLTIREPGGPNRASTGIGPRDGLPRTFTAGRFLAPPGGYPPGLTPLGMVGIPAETLPEAALAELQVSRAWVKVYGDSLGQDGRLKANFRPETLAEAAHRVHAAGGRLAIHANLPEVIEAALEAGFDSIEHGFHLERDQIAALAARRVALVPTLNLLRGDPRAMGRESGMAPEEIDRAVRSQARFPAFVREAVEAGVTVLAGTDAGVVPHGTIQHEIRCLLATGMLPETALAAASWTARRFLGLPGIEEGAPADLVAYPDDPRQDPEVLARPSLILLDGQLAREPRSG